MACAAISLFPRDLHSLRFLRRLGPSVVLILLLSAAFAQDASTGALRGTVVDSTGGRIADAVIVLVDDATGFRYSLVSDSSGRFVFPLARPRLACRQK